MTDIDKTLSEIRRRDSMYPTEELGAGAVADRRTLLNIIDMLQDEIRDRQNTEADVRNQLETK